MACFFTDTVGTRWGWGNPKSPQICLEPVDPRSRATPKLRDVRVHLEERGQHILHATGDLSAKRLDSLRRKLTTHRARIEEIWIRTIMLYRGWLDVSVNGPDVILTAYRNTPMTFTRTLDARELVRDQAAVSSAEIDRHDGRLIVGLARPRRPRQVRIDLGDLLFLPEVIK